MERGRPSSAIATSPINWEVENRTQKRTRHRLTCDLLVGTTRHHAIVRDISPAGLFVETEARPKPNSVVQVIFPARDGRPEITAEAGVARRRAVPPARLRGVVALLIPALLVLHHSIEDTEQLSLR